MTILDSIKAAEHKALENKRQALAMAKDYLRNAESGAVRAADEMIANARMVAREKVAAAEQEASVKMQGLLAERDARNNLLIESTRERIAQAADYIAGKVVG